MECTCIRQTELPQTTKLFADYTYHFDRVRSFYNLFPFDPGSYAAAAAQIDLPDDRRAALVSALRIQNGDSELLTRLAQPGTVAVVTGQQVGLFSGPAYTIYKALTAVKLARELTARGIPAVPIFWLATEDHDFAEINQCWTFGSSHRPIELAVRDYDAAAIAGRSARSSRAIILPKLCAALSKNFRSARKFRVWSSKPTAAGLPSGRLSERFSNSCSPRTSCCTSIPCCPLSGSWPRPPFAPCSR